MKTFLVSLVTLLFISEFSFAESLSAMCLEKTKALQAEHKAESKSLETRISDERAQAKAAQIKLDNTKKAAALRSELRKKQRAEIAAIPECAQLKKK